LGEVEPVNLSIASSTAVSRRDSDSSRGLIFGESVKLGEWVADSLDVVGVFAGEDFVGEIDLARSVVVKFSELSYHNDRGSGKSN